MFFAIFSYFSSSTIPVVEDKSLKTQYLVSYVPVEANVGGPHRCQGEPRSSANYESSPGQILSLLQTVLSASLLGSKTGGPPGVISCPQLCLSLPARWSSQTWQHPCWLSLSVSSLSP